MKLVSSLLLLGLFTFCACQPALVVLNQKGLHPEGLEWSPLTGFLVSSTTAGTVYKADDLGNLVPFVQSPKLSGTLGLQIDSPRNRLVMVNSNGAAWGGANTGFLAGIMIANLQTGAVISDVDLSSLGGQVPHFGNDLAIDKDGNIYVTDSLSPTLWKVSTTGVASVFLQDQAFAPPAGGTGLNGIDYHPNGYLIVGHQSAGKLFKVPIANPQAFTVVKTDIPTPGLDGLTFRPGGGNLIAVGSPVQKVWEIASIDDWNTAVVIGEGDSKYATPSTAALRNGLIYILHPYFGSEPAQFQIERVDLTAINEPPVPSVTEEPTVTQTPTSQPTPTTAPPTTQAPSSTQTPPSTQPPVDTATQVPTKTEAPTTQAPSETQQQSSTVPPVIGTTGVVDVSTTGVIVQQPPEGTTGLQEVSTTGVQPEGTTGIQSTTQQPVITQPESTTGSVASTNLPATLLSVAAVLLMVRA